MDTALELQHPLARGRKGALGEQVCECLKEVKKGFNESNEYKWRHLALP